MSAPLKRHHRMRIDAMAQAGQIAKLDRLLSKLAAKGFDVAGVPFRVLDAALSQRQARPFAQIAPLARHTVGGQPALLRAVLADMDAGHAGQLRTLVADESAHPMTRFEAMGWATHVTHGASMPATGPAVETVFQFWDNAPPPP